MEESWGSEVQFTLGNEFDQGSVRIIGSENLRSFQEAYFILNQAIQMISKRDPADIEGC